MTSLHSIGIKSSERAIIVGNSGSGKTTLAEMLIRHMPNLIAIDPKHELEIQREMVIITDLDRLSHAANKAVETHDAIIFRPNPEFLEDLDEIDRFFKFCFLRHNTFIYVDELLGVVRSYQTFPTYLKYIYTQGRSRNVGILGSSQRPSGIPLFTISECIRLYKFFLLLAADQERMGQYMGDIVIEPQNLPSSSPYGSKHRKHAHADRHSFYYRNILDRNIDEAREYIINLQSEELKEE